MENDKDPNWKWGCIYYNPEDKRLFPPKRFGMGWTPNFANYKSVIAFIILISAILGYIFFIMTRSEK
jgi:uncharacterized membrane protein